MPPIKDREMPSGPNSQALEFFNHGEYLEAIAAKLVVDFRRSPHKFFIGTQEHSNKTLSELPSEVRYTDGSSMTMLEAQARAAYLGRMREFLNPLQKDSSPDQAEQAKNIAAWRKAALIMHYLSAQPTNRQEQAFHEMLGRFYDFSRRNVSEAILGEAGRYYHRVLATYAKTDRAAKYGKRDIAEAVVKKGVNYFIHSKGHEVLDIALFAGVPVLGTISTIQSARRWVEHTIPRFLGDKPFYIYHLDKFGTVYFDDSTIMQVCDSSLSRFQGLKIGPAYSPPGTSSISTEFRHNPFSMEENWRLMYALFFQQNDRDAVSSMISPTFLRGVANMLPQMLDHIDFRP